MEINKHIKPNSVFLILIILYLCVYKIPHLFYPFFWDASWVYAPAIFSMIEHGPSIVPWSIPIEQSRGHPLFFHFTASLWSLIFGESPVSLHAFALLISIGTIMVLYMVIRKLFGKEAAILGVSVLVTQEIFLAQSSQLLPEMLLTFLIFTSLWFYLNKKWVLFVIAATALMYTKESGIIFLLSLFLYEFLNPSLNLKRLSKGQLKILGCIVLPCLFSAIHYILLKLKFGWIFYPLHLEYFKESWPAFHQDLRFIWDEIFVKNGRIYLSLLLGLSLILRFGKKHYLLLTGLFILTYLGYITFYRLWQTPDFPLKIACLLALIIIYLILIFKAFKKKDQIIGLGLIYIGLFTLFSAYNVFTIRYLLNIMPWFALFVAWGVTSIITNSQVIYLLSVIIIVAFTFHFHRVPGLGIGDGDLNYLDGLAVQKELVEYVQKENLYKTKIYSSLLEKVALQNPKLGFLQSDTVFEQVDFILETTTRYAIFTNVAFEPTYYQMDSLGFNLIHRIEIGDAWGEVFENEGMRE